MNIFAICITDTNENVILRMVVERPEELIEIFTLKNINYYLSKVVVVKIDTPLELNSIFKLFSPMI